MFVRKQRNRSGTITVEVIIKDNGKFKEIHNLGTVKTESEADVLMLEGKSGYQVEVAVKMPWICFLRKN